jgi:hypothetical protein
LPELDIQLSSFRSDVCLPGESLVQMKPRHLTSAATGMGALLIVKGGQTFVRVVNVTCTDLAWFTCILHRVCHSARELRWVCRCRVADTGSSLADNTATSSANDAIVVWLA